MKLLDTLKLSGMAMLFAFGLAACDKLEPAENAGKTLDQAASDAGKKIVDTVDKVGEKMNEQNAKAVVVIDDAEITAKIKAAIFAEPGLKTLQISVDTVKGAVTLSGSVDSRANSNMAKGLAGAVSGVNEVHNQLVLKSTL